MDTYRIGVIADTHGLLRPSALSALGGVDRIIHAGDVGKPGVLTALETVAPVVAVRGNVDRGPWAEALPLTAILEVGALRLYVLHRLQDLDREPVATGLHAVISGHSHRPIITWREGVLFLNPGAAGPRRFNLPITLALLTVSGAQVEAQFVDLAE